MYKPDLEKAEEPKIKLPKSVGSQRKQRNSRKTSIYASITMEKPLTVWITTVENFHETGIPDHLTCLLRNLYAGQEAAVRTGHEMTDWLIIGKGTQEDSILSPCLFNFYAEYVMQNCWLDESQAEIKTARRNINNLAYADDTTLMADNEEELKG